MSLSRFIIVFTGIFLISACCSQKNVSSYSVKTTYWTAGGLETLHLKRNGRYKRVRVPHFFGGRNIVWKGKWTINQDTLTLHNKEYSLYLLINDSTNLHKFNLNESGKLNLIKSW